MIQLLFIEMNKLNNNSLGWMRQFAASIQCVPLCFPSGSIGPRKWSGKSIMFLDCVICSHVDTPPTTITNKNFLLQVINRKNLNCLVKIAISYSVGRWEWVYLFPQNLWKESRENPQDQFPFFSNFWWGCCVIVGENKQRTGSGKKKEKSDGRFYSEKTEFWRPKSKWILGTQWKKESSSVSYYWG